MKKIDPIIDAFSDGVWICDKEGDVVLINKASEKINCIKAQRVVGRNMKDLLREGYFDQSATLEVLKSREPVTLIQNLKSGKQILVTGNPVFDDRGELSLVVVNERDITELNKLRNELEKSRALAREYRFEISQLKKRNDPFLRALTRSDSMCKVFNKAMRVAQVDSTVLIQGESGTGKSTIAKIIHETSPRSNGPFIRVDCGSIPETLIESELFGYEKGAFTGARAKGKPGFFEMAEQGTLFLDEVGAIPLKVQAKLLRFLEENEVIRIGGLTANRINTRILSATNRNLEDVVRKGGFRKDLLFRIDVIPVLIPPLRERVEDIPTLIHFFLTKFNKMCSTKKIFLPEAIECLCKYPFLGNIRELANLIEQLVVLTPTEAIHFEDLPSHVRMEHHKDDIASRKNEWNLSAAVERTERKIIIRALKTFRTQRKAASPLGIHQSTLARKIKRWGVNSDAIMHRDV